MLGERGYLAHIKEKEKEFKKYLKVGFGAGIYLGLRTFIGPDIDLNIISPDIWQVLDTAAVVGSVSLVGFCGPAYGIRYLIRKSSEKSLKKAESKLEGISKDYSSEGEQNKRIE
ncbi:MAG: hypothetical protein NTZ83_00730 [Candidatus Pacearchaeota archaeon]|nr:hypothetical protein [Candidatus Pacearchaeota archaeon]